VILVTDKNLRSPGGIESTIRRLYQFDKNNKIVSPNNLKLIKFYESNGEKFHYFDISFQWLFVRNLLTKTR